MDNKKLSVKVHTKTHDFLKDWIPDMVKKSITNTEHKPRSKFTILHIKKSKLKTICKLLHEQSLLDDVNAEIEKDLKQLAYKELCNSPKNNEKNKNT